MRRTHPSIRRLCRATLSLAVTLLPLLLLVTLSGAQVRAALSQAASPPDALDAAVTTYIDWRRHVTTYYGSDASAVSNEISKANLLLGEALREADELATERCNAQRPAQGFALQRYTGYAKRFGLVNTHAALEERLGRCWSFRLTFNAAITRTDSQGTDRVRMDATVALRFDKQRGRVIGSGPLTWQELSYDYRNGAFRNCVPSPSKINGMFDASDAVRGLTLTPVSSTNLVPRAQLAYDPGEPGGQAKWACPLEEGTLELEQELDWWAPSYEAFHLDELSLDGNIVTPKRTADGPSFSWDYQRSNSAGGTITEQTTLTIEHTPAS